MADEDTFLEEAMDNLKEAGQRIKATQSLMRSEGMTDGENLRDLLTRLSTALAMTEAAYLEARRRRDLWLAAELRGLKRSYA
jgi:predicted RNase H-like HicB family nuclease